MADRKRIVYTNRPWEATGICSGCRLCELWCSLNHYGVFNPKRARIRVVELKTGVDVPVTCQQCTDAACVKACRFEAIEVDVKLGIPLVDQEVCTGCGECIGACPFGVIYIDPETNRAIKCDLCGGGEPACVKYCPSNVLADLDDIGVSEYNRRRFAVLLAAGDEFGRYRPGGEEPILKRMQKVVGQ